MNRMEIFQEVYGKDYVFTETELSQLLQVAELIVQECMKVGDMPNSADGMYDEFLPSEMIAKHFGV